MLKRKCIGIIGCGNIGEAIICGILSRKIIPKSRIIISDARQSRIVYLKHRYGVRASDNATLAERCGIIILAVKLHDLNSVMNDISPHFSASTLLISVLAGVPIEKIRQVSKKRVQVVRAMPNMGALVGEAASAISFRKGTKGESKKIVMRIFSSLGEAIEVEEGIIDAITAVSGSGPAYFFYLVELLIESAVGLGIDREVAKVLVIKTALGSAKLLDQMKESPQLLREKITSKGGTTEAAFKVLHAKNMGGLIKEAVANAAKKAKELSEGV